MRHLHHPALYKLTFLASVTTINDAIGALHKALYNGKLLLDALVVDKLYTEAWRYHGQGAQAPPLPVLGIIVGLFKGAEVSEGPRHLISVSFHVTIAGTGGSYNASYVLGYAGFLGDTYYHLYLFLIY